MTICAVVAGCDVLDDIADYCRAKESWFKECLHMRLLHGLASSDTIGRIWGMIEPEEFERSFQSWVSSVCRRTDGEVISIDGKTICGSAESGKSGIHMVSAWAHENQLVLGQLATDIKSNEITAVPKLLDTLDVEGCIITADAMSCQKAITQRIAEKKADYVIGLKDNQANLRADAQEYFTAALAERVLYPALQHQRTMDNDHGRIEVRDYYLTTDIDWLHGLTQWHKLHALGMVRSRVTKGDQVTTESRFFITSLTDVERFAHATRAHWGIENSLHWCLDVTFREDRSRIRKDHSAQNMSVVRRLVLNILKNYPEKISLARKRRRCSYDDLFLARVLLSVLS